MQPPPSFTPQNQPAQLLTPHIFHRISFWEVFCFGGFKHKHASESLNTHQEPNTLKINQFQTKAAVYMFINIISSCKNNSCLISLDTLCQVNFVYLRELARFEVRLYTSIGGGYVSGSCQNSWPLTSYYAEILSQLPNYTGNVCSTESVKSMIEFAELTCYALLFSNVKNKFLSSL